MLSVLSPDPRLYNEKPKIIESSVQFSSAGSWKSPRGVSSRKKMTVCQIVICELL
jgi:hypothetical protein